MIEITCCRMGVRTNLNFGHKGKFKRQFKDLRSLALFIDKAGGKLFYPSLRKELTREQRRLLSEKLCSLWRINKITI